MFVDRIQNIFNKIKNRSVLECKGRLPLDCEDAELETILSTAFEKKVPRDNTYFIVVLHALNIFDRVELFHSTFVCFNFLQKVLCRRG